MLGDNNHISLLKVLFTMMTNLNLFDDVKHGFVWKKKPFMVGVAYMLSPIATELK